jgi:2-enoate reductase
LYEKRELGGWLIEAAVPEFKADFRNLLSYLITQIEKLGVNVVAKEATLEDIEGGGFDAIIVATGSSPVVPRIHGIDRPFVLQAVNVLAGTKTRENVIVVGGGAVGCDTALYLAEHGKRVTVIEMRDAIATDLSGGLSAQGGFWERFKRTNHKVHLDTRLEEVADNGIIVSDGRGRTLELPCDTLVLAVGMKPNDQLASALEKANLEFFLAGDCIQPRNLYEAIHEGNTAANMVGRY